MRVTRSLIAGFQNAPDIAHTDKTRSPYCLDAERRAETCHQSPSPQNHPPKGEWDYVWITAYRRLPETWARMMKALQIRFGGFAPTAVVISDASNGSKGIDAYSYPPK